MSVENEKLIIMATIFLDMPKDENLRQGESGHKEGLSFTRE